MVIVFIVVLLVSIAALAGIYFISKIYGITKRDIIACTILMVSTFLVYFTIHLAVELNTKLSTAPFKISNEFVTEIDFQNDSINDSILMDYLIDMRVPHPKIVFAQAKHESELYKSELYVDNFNLFGMKPSAKRTTTSNKTNRGFKRYCNWRESVTDYILWQYYNNADKLSDEDYMDYLVKSKYAQDSQYIQKIKKYIK